MADRYVSNIFISLELLRNSIVLQIRNLMSLAHTLATVGNVSVGFSYLKTVMKANGLRFPGHVRSNINTLDDNSLYE
jgi:hypothetical protein